jgi:kynurenine formamidase
VTDGIAIVDDLLARVSNWGRWGADDDRGTLNLLTEELSAAALSLPRHGRVVRLGRTLTPRPAWPGDLPIQHHMLTAGAESPERGEYVLADWFGVQPHGLTITHLDALNHLTWHGRLYNGAPAGSVSTVKGGARGSAEHVSQGVVTRGVLLDVPGHLGVDWIEPESPITPAQLDACAAAAGVEVRAGDVLLIRTGRDPRLRAAPMPGPAGPDLAGLDVDCLPWLHERDVAVMGSDGAHDVVPPRLSGVHTPVHVVSLVGMGMWLLDNLTLEELASTCRDLGAWEFLFTMAPIALKNSTGVPVNPLAVF